MSKTGLKDWIIQRLTAMYLGLYIILMAICLLAHSPLHYINWLSLFSNTAFQVVTLLALVALCWHAWIGIWTVITDYIHAPVVRMIVQTLVFLVLLAYLFWGAILILWGISFGL